MVFNDIGVGHWNVVYVLCFSGPQLTTNILNGNQHMVAPNTCDT